MKIEVKDKRPRNWFWSDSAIFELGLDPYELAVYFFLCNTVDRNTQTAYPSVQTIGRGVGAGRTKIKAALRRLVDLNVISVDQRRHEGEVSETNIYTLLSAEFWKKEPKREGSPHDHKQEDINNKKEVLLVRGRHTTPTATRRQSPSPRLVGCDIDYDSVGVGA